MQIGTSSDLMVGETVITIGNAFGYENTVSVGIISALHRDVTLSDEQVYRNLIQTDACINPGNSGGPLINVNGELIGINVAVRAGAQGIGFALPIDEVKRVATEMLSTRRLASNWHGLVSSEQRRGSKRGVVVSEVQQGSPAEASGFKPGDELVRVGDLAIASPLDVERGMLDVQPGHPATVTIRRGKSERAIPLDVKPLLAGAAATPDDLVWRLLGLKTQPVSNDYVSSVSPKLRGGLYIQAVSPGSPAAQAAIQKGDILVGMNVGTQALGNNPGRQHPLRTAAARNHADPDARSLPGPPQRHSATPHHSRRHRHPIDPEPMRTFRERRKAIDFRGISR